MVGDLTVKFHINGHLIFDYLYANCEGMPTAEKMEMVSSHTFIYSYLIINTELHINHESAILLVIFIYEALLLKYKIGCYSRENALHSIKSNIQLQATIS